MSAENPEMYVSKLFALSGSPSLNAIIRGIANGATSIDVLRSIGFDENALMEIIEEVQDKHATVLYFTDSEDSKGEPEPYGQKAIDAINYLVQRVEDMRVMLPTLRKGESFTKKGKRVTNKKPRITAQEKMFCDWIKKCNIDLGVSLDAIHLEVEEAAQRGEITNIIPRSTLARYLDKYRKS